MAAIQNDRDILLQAASPRVVPILIPIDQIEGLGPALKSLRIKSSAATFIGSSGVTNPSTITLTAEKLGGLAGAVSWSVITGTATITPSGDTCTVTGSTVLGYSVTVRARVTVDGLDYDAQTTLTKLGTFSAQETVNLTSQVTGQLSMGNVTGYGALALLNQVNLNTQTVGALNGATQVTNLGTLAYANAIAANQIGAGQLAAGVIYAGVVNASQVSAGSFTGKTFTGGTFSGSVFNNADTFITKSTGQGYISIESGNTTLTVFGTGGTSLIRGSESGFSTSTGAYAASFSHSGSGSPIVIGSKSTFPTPVQGGIAYHSTYQFIFSNGAAWYTPTWTKVS